MNMVSLYSQSEIEKSRKNGTKCLVFAVVSLILFALAASLSIVLATYETKMLWMVLGSFLSIVPLATAFLFFFKRKHILDACFLYQEILSRDGERVCGVYESVSDNVITLQNGFEVYEVSLRIEENIKTVYLLSSQKGLFNPEEGKPYVFIISSSYLKEWGNE